MALLTTARGLQCCAVSEESADLHELLPARRYASAGLCDSDVSVCPSVRPSHAGIVPSRAKAGS